MSTDIATPTAPVTLTEGAKKEIRKLIEHNVCKIKGYANKDACISFTK